MSKERLDENRIQLNEVSRSSLLNKSKQGDDYVPWNQQYGRNRYFRRIQQKVSKSVQEYNSINMNKLFKDNILDITIKVTGETSDYLVRISFAGFLDKLHQQLRNDDEINLRIITRALVSAFNQDDVYFNCSCPDFQYRHRYWATRNGYVAGTPETRPSDITNPTDTKGGCCKHVSLVLSNTSWIVKVASVITNYINYMQKHYENLYANIIYPAIYDRKYTEPVQQDLFNDDELASGEDAIDTSNKWAKTKNQFQAGNEYKFKPADNIKGQRSFNFDSLMSDSSDVNIDDNED